MTILVICLIVITVANVMVCGATQYMVEEMRDRLDEFSMIEVRLVQALDTIDVLGARLNNDTAF